MASEIVGSSACDRGSFLFSPPPVLGRKTFAEHLMRIHSFLSDYALTTHSCLIHEP